LKRRAGCGFSCTFAVPKAPLENLSVSDRPLHPGDLLWWWPCGSPDNRIRERVSADRVGAVYSWAPSLTAGSEASAKATEWRNSVSVGVKTLKLHAPEKEKPDRRACRLTSAESAPHGVRPDPHAQSLLPEGHAKAPCVGAVQTLCRSEPREKIFFSSASLNVRGFSLCSGFASAAARSPKHFSRLVSSPRATSLFSGSTAPYRRSARSAS
jgi:hypothetical protein